MPWAVPLLRWAGSKRALLPVLLRNIPGNFTRYHEPFAGSACLFFAVRPHCAVLGDTNAELMRTYDVIRRHPRLTARRAAAWKPTVRTYNRLRSAEPAALSPIVRAARFVFLNRHSFNAVYRTNRQGAFNVPMGSRTGNLKPEAAFYRCAMALRSASLHTGDFVACLTGLGAGDFVYLDPPYTSRTRRGYGEYGYDCFSARDESRLLSCLMELDSAGATFVLSYTQRPILTNLPATWSKLSVRVRRHVAGFANYRRTIRELIISNRHLIAG